MAENLKDKTALVVDHGLFFSLAERLARDFGRVLYNTPWETGFSQVVDSVMGGGMESISGVERCEDIWKALPEVDIVIFPDCQDGGLQTYLESQGKRVWGSRYGSRIETDRVFLKDMLRKNGLQTAPYRVCEGIPELRACLRETTNQYVKMSKFRERETWHHINYQLSEPVLDELEYRWSGVKQHVKFLVEAGIDTDLELGCDTYCVDGQYPDHCVHGPEIKDKCYACAVIPTKDLPPQLLTVNEMLVPWFREQHYRNWFSTEVRIKGDDFYFTDSTNRQPSPAGECELELIENLGEVAWHGAAGDLVQPEWAAKYACEAMIMYHGDDRAWRPLNIPKEQRQWVKLYRPMFNPKTGLFQIVPKHPHFDEVGNVVGIGDTIGEAMDKLKEHVDAIADNPIDVDVESLYSALKEIRSAEEQGIEWSGEKVPKPETALED